MKPFILAVFLAAVPGMASAQKPPSTPPDSGRQLPGDTVVAVVDGDVIHLSDLESFSRTKDPKKLFQLNQQLFEFRESMLGLMLGERLLRLEAQEAGMTVEELLDQHLKIEPVAEAEIQEVIARQPPGTIDEALVRPLIRRYLEDRKKEAARDRYLADLVARARKAPRRVVLQLRPPRQPVAVSESDPTEGAGAVDLVEFSDFQCPFCRSFQPVLRDILTKFEGKVRHVWKDYPLPIHPFAAPAAAAARCAQEQGKFWQYHDLLFANQQALTADDLKRHASALGLDADTFNRCVDGGRYRDEVTAALNSASAYAVPATPTVFINGRMVTGVAPAELYARIISEELDN